MQGADTDEIVPTNSHCTPLAVAAKLLEVESESMSSSILSWVTLWRHPVLFSDELFDRILCDVDKLR